MFTKGGDKNIIWKGENLIRVLKEDGIAVMPTDTLYGIVSRAESESAVNRIYELRKRAPEKPCIILIGNTGELEKFSIALSPPQKKVLEEYWTGLEPTSIVLDCPDESLSYLHRGTNTLAFRLPWPRELRDLLLKTGPLIAPSANPEGLPPAENISEAKKYFGDAVDPVRGREGSQRSPTSNGVDLYVNGGTLAGKASKVIKLHKDGAISILRG